MDKVLGHINCVEGAFELKCSIFLVNCFTFGVQDMRKLCGASGPPRFRLKMSDGQHSFSSFLLATQLHHLVEEDLLVPLCVCKLKKTTSSTLSDGRYGLVLMFCSCYCRHVVVIVDMEVLQSAEETGEKIGNPVPFSLSDARVTNKSNIRNWNNSRGEGKLFSFEIVDESGEIRITAFNNEVDKFFPLVEQGKVYYISKASLKPANKQFMKLNNDYEMTLNSNSSIVPCEDSQGVPTMQCDFVPIKDLADRDNDAIVDVIGVCKSAEDVTRITTRANRDVSKRALSLMDMTGKEVSVTLWGEEAEKFDASGSPVVAIKKARLSDFRGKSLSASFSSTIMVNPDIPQAFCLRAWYDQGGYALDSQSLTETGPATGSSAVNWKTFSEMKKDNLGHGEKADYFSCVATVVFIRKESCLYQACPSADCYKKVIDQNNGMYHCGKCNKEFPNFKYRLLLSANLADCWDNQWVTCFQETAEVLLGCSAAELGQLRDTDETAFDEVFQKANFSTHIFKNRVKLETYNDESRVKVTVLEILPVDHREYSRNLLSSISKLAR
uniref:Replication protein A subunit n=1 Tax=Nothobranchius furzeri TaxID=105023 RepID=A0A8C6PIC3_NOTFU